MRKANRLSFAKKKEPQRFCFQAGKSKVIYTRDGAYLARNKGKHTGVTQFRVYTCPRRIQGVAHYHLTSRVY